VNDYLPELYTDRDLTRARRKAKAAGWVQGGGAVIAIGFVYNLIGWIPTLAVLALVAFGIYKLVSKPKKTDD
jgi:hypothetical protein